MAVNARGLEEHDKPISGEEILAVHQGTQLDYIEWLPDSSRIIFRSAVSGASEIWNISREGYGMERMTVGSAASTPRVSPDGKWVSYISAKSGSAEIWLHPLVGELGAVDRQLTRFGAAVNSASWAPDGKTMVVASNRYGSFDVYEVDVPDGAWRRLTSDNDCYEHYPVYSPDGKNIIYVSLNKSWEDHSIKCIDRNGGNTNTLVEDTDFFDYQIGRRFGHPLISPDGRWLLFRSHRNKWINYWVQSIEGLEHGGNSEPNALYAEEFDQSAESGSISCGEASWSPDSKYVAHVSSRNGNIQLRVVSLESGESVLIAGEDEGVASNPSWSPDGRQIAFMYQSFTSPADLWIADIERVGETGISLDTRRKLTESMPRGLGKSLDAPTKVEYESFDGRMISAYVYKPRNAGKEPGPAILEIHGGPHDQFRDTMHLVVQYYVQRGYTVLMPNIRGSSGLGKEFEELIKTGWGVDDLKDVLCGAQYLVDEGLADPNRIGLTGQSYGGSMAMMVACCAPAGMFQACVSRTGYADWSHYYRHGSLPTVNLLGHSLGSVESNRKVYEASAAINAVEGMQTPLLVIDEETGPEVPALDLRTELVAMLRGLAKPVRYKKYKSTGGPYANHPAGANELLPDMMEYFSEYLG